MLSSIVVSLLALTPLALAAPASSPSSSDTRVERRGFDGGFGYGGLGGYYGGGGGFGHGGYFGGFGGRRGLAAERFRKHKNKALLAAERKNHVNFDKDTALAAKNYKEANFAAEKDRKFDNADLRKAKVAELAKEKAFKNNVRFGEGGGGFWKRQFDEDGDGEGLDLGSSDDSIDSTDSSPLGDDSDSYDPSSSSSSSTVSPDASSVGQDGLGFGGFDGGFDGGLYDGGLYDGGLYDGGDFGGVGGGGFDFLGNNNENDSGAPSPDDDSTPSPDANDLGAAGAVDNDDSTPSSPASNQVSTDQQPDGGSLTKRGFGGYYGGGLGGFGGYGGFGRERFRKNTRLRNAKLIRLAELENARRRKALDRAKVKFNTKKFNELKFKNDIHFNRDDKAKELALKDRKDADASRVSRIGGDFF